LGHLGKKGTTVGTTAHGGWATSNCPTEEQATPTQQVTEVTVQRRIENALKDLEIFNARAFAADARLEGRKWVVVSVFSIEAEDG
jgi:hypothetical protein